MTELDMVLIVFLAAVVFIGVVSFWYFANKKDE